MDSCSVGLDGADFSCLRSLSASVGEIGQALIDDYDMLGVPDEVL